MNIILVITLTQSLVVQLTASRANSVSGIRQLDPNMALKSTSESPINDLNNEHLKFIDYYTIDNTTTVDFEFPVASSDITLETNVISNSLVSLCFTTVNDTMSFLTGITTESSLSYTIMRLKVFSYALEDVTEVKDTLPPITSLTFIVESSTDVSLEEIVTSTVSTEGTLPMYIVRAVTTEPGTAIMQVCNPTVHSEPGTLLWKLEPTTTACNNPSTAATGTCNTDLCTSTTPVTSTFDAVTTSHTSVFNVKTRGSSTPTSHTTKQQTSIEMVSTSSKPILSTSKLPPTNRTSSVPNVTTRGVRTSSWRANTMNEATTNNQTDFTNISSMPTSENNRQNDTSSSPNVTTSAVSTIWHTTSNQTDVSKISFMSTISSSESTTINATSRAENVTTRGVTTSHWHSTVTPTADSCDREYSCVNCTTARVCAPTAGGQDLQEVARFSCPDYAPWCDSHSGTCSRVRSPECDLPVVGDLTCMRDGHFPDPNSCSDYYLCDDDVPLQFTCLYPTPYYSPVSRSCSNSSSDCVDYVSLCKDKSGLKVPVPRVHNLFLYCVDGAVEVVDRCIGAYMFDFERQQCVPECPHDGLFPRDDDCAGYYRCSPSPVGDAYVMTNLTCPQGKAFSESAYECVDRSLVHNCNVTYIS